MEKVDPKYLIAWRDRFARCDSESHDLAARARKDLARATEILKKFGAKRIFVFGSLCRIDRFHPGSDIDIAVEGIPPKQFLRAAADLMMAADFPIDLKPLEELDEVFRDMITKKGELIYAE
jgi:predicted nucleotidyltransferase